MKNLIKVGETINASEKMSSLQIAEITGKQHQHVLRDIDSLIEQGLDASNFGLTSYTDKSNRNQRCYELTKKGCLILASGYDALLREKIINRWEELESKERNKFQIPQTYSEALMLAAKQAEQIERQQLLIEEQKPKALFADAVATSKRSCLMSELAKILQQNGISIGQNRLFSWMRDNGYLCRKGEYYNQPTQRSMELCLFEIKKTTISRGDGTIIISNTTKVTGKGQVYFINKFLSK